jgi:N-acyl-L-homoserine lactone synthetase
MDTAARRFVRSCAPLHFRVAHSPAELEAVFRLRYATVIERGWATPADFPDGLERDAYDDQALQIIGCVEDTMLATIRLVLPSAQRPLPTETAFDLEIEPRQQIADLGRAIVMTADRKDRPPQALLGLVGQSWLEARARRFSELCGAATAPMLRLYRLLGFRLMPLGSPRMYWGEERHPYKLDVLQTAKSLSQRRG